MSSLSENSSSSEHMFNTLTSISVTAKKLHSYIKPYAKHIYITYIYDRKQILKAVLYPQFLKWVKTVLETTSDMAHRPDEETVSIHRRQKGVINRILL